MAASPETPLQSVPGWTPDLVRKLAQNWITTAEQVVGAAANPAGLHHLAEHLGVSDREMVRLVARARASLPPGVAQALAQPVDPGQYGLGALPPPDNA